MNLPPDKSTVGVALDQLLGFINFSSGSEDPKFYSNLNQLVSHVSLHSLDDNSPDVLDRVEETLLLRLDVLKAENKAFENVEQAESAIRLTFDHLIPRYMSFHSDLLFHQDKAGMFNAFLVGRFLESVLKQGGPWDETERIVDGAMAKLNNFVGHRPVAVLETQRCEPYAHEWVRPIPIYLRGVGAAGGKYHDIVNIAVELLKSADPNITRQAQFDFEKLDELALDPRAFDFDHPANRRPNHQFGQWDPHTIDGSGFYRRFVVNQMTVDSLLARAEGAEGEDREQFVFEAAAVFAGTVLMASGICGRGPGAHDSTVSLASLMPVVAGYRDRFYDVLLDKLSGRMKDRLMEEAGMRGQPFASARQDINAQLAQKRAKQLVHVRLASIFARMGYLEAADRQASVVPVASARIMCQIECLLANSQQLILNREISQALDKIPRIMALIQRGIQCGAIVDPWNMLGFDGNYDLFHGAESAIRDHRIDELVEMVEMTSSLCSLAWSEAASIDDTKLCDKAKISLREIVDWWLEFAPHEVFSIGASNPQELFEASEHVARSLNLWHQAGAAAGDIEFWKDHAEMFDSPKAYGLVIDALMQRDDTKTPVALMVHWLSNSHQIPISEGDTSLHDFIERWIVEMVNRFVQPSTGPEERVAIWNQIRKFYDFVEANAGQYWNVPGFELGDLAQFEPEADDYSPHSDSTELADDENEITREDIEDHLDQEKFEGEGDLDELYEAAYDNMVYKDSTDDGIDSVIFEEGGFDSEEELEDEVDRVTDRLEFLVTIATYWKHVSGIPLKELEGLELSAPTMHSLELGMPSHSHVVEGWIEQARRNQEKLGLLLRAVNGYALPEPSGDHHSLMTYDRHRLFKESLLSRVIAAAIEVEDAIRSMSAVVAAINFEQNERPLIENCGESVEQKLWVAIFASILLRRNDLLLDNFPDLILELQELPLLYVPLSRLGDPKKIVDSRLRQSALIDLLGCLPMMGLLVETRELTNATLAMERNHPPGAGAVTEFDELFRTAYSAGVFGLIFAGKHLEPTPEEKESQSKTFHEPVLFECLEMWTECMLSMWLEHSHTLRLSVLEKVSDKEQWKKLVEFIETYGADLFSQQFLHLGNIRAILHQGVDKWFEQLEKSENDSYYLVSQLEKTISKRQAIHNLTLILEAIIENYNEYRDYNGTTTQSDRGELLFILLDFLRLRAKYDRVCWHLKPVVWAHEFMVREKEAGVAKLWRRSLAERVGPEAEKYSGQLAKLQEKYSVQMSTIADRLSERFMHPMHVDRLKALVGPAMADPDSKASQSSFELLEHETQTFTNRPLGVGLELPNWLAALDSEVKFQQLPEFVRESERFFPIEPMEKSIHKLRDQLGKQMEDRK